ncbi:VOC family protein [Nitratireductor soli]|uniref:VOC family protein n=1 Tax=Nitratireductor soli TaxID=1670619 RepID=UPI00065E8108|nr:VOC family protein [Nitratireductor soli]
MLSTSRIGNICFYVNDIDRTEAFYRDVIGLPVQRMAAEKDEGDWLLASIKNNVDLIFFRAECRPGNTPIIVFDLAEGGIDDVVEGLAEQGATIVTPVSHAPGGWSAEFADPDGHVVSVYQSAETPRRK